MDQAKFATRAIHAGQAPDESTGAIVPPVYFTSTYVQSAPGENKGFAYARISNPSRTALENAIASLENARYCSAFASGIACADAIFKSLAPGDHVVVSSDLYGGNYRLFREVYGRFGIKSEYVDTTNIDAVQSAIGPDTKLLWLETPTNPMIKIVDIVRLSELAHAFDADVVVDNTFASPFLQNPLVLGADLVLHSTTKYLSGHSDIIGGAVCTNSPEWADRLTFQVKCAGAVPGPMDCFLVSRGIKTLHVRMERHCENAFRIAGFLQTHPKVSAVHYPGLPTDDGHELAKRQMHGFGGMIAFRLKDDSIDKALAVLSGNHVFSLAESLGGVESLIGHPATMTHASIPPEVRRKTGLADSLIRVSVGIEDIDDLIEDLDRALSRV